jgi:hypothetical protein
MEVFSNHSALVMNDFVELECTRIPGEKDRQYPVKSNPGGSENLSWIELREGLMAWRDALTPEEISTGYYYGTRPSVNKGHYDALEFLRKCVVEDRPTETNEWRGAVSTIMGLGALESLETGLPCRLDLDMLK